jgi:hypothetical protein
MRRWARPVHFARLRVNNLTSALMHAPQAKWSRHLQLAGAILQEELKVPGPTARAILAKSVAHALSCAQAMDQRPLLRSRSESKTKLHKSFSRVEKCIARAPAYLRSTLNNHIYASTPTVIDTEAIEAIIDAVYQTFAHSELESAKTAVRALSVADLKTEYETLDLPTRRNCETALSSLPPDAVSGRAIFKTLTRAIDESPAPAAGISAEAGGLIINYVAAVATIWRENDLRPSRGNPSNFIGSLSLC